MKVRDFIYLNLFRCSDVEYVSHVMRFTPCDEAYKTYGKGFLEELYGKIVAVWDVCDEPDDECYPVIWTTKYVIDIEIIDGEEKLIVIPRHPHVVGEKHITYFD